MCGLFISGNVRQDPPFWTDTAHMLALKHSVLLLSSLVCGANAFLDPGLCLVSRTPPPPMRILATSQLTDRVEAMRRKLTPPALQRLLAGIASWRDSADAANADSSCDMLFNDEYATWYVCRQQPEGTADEVSCTLLDEPGFGAEPGLGPGTHWICKIRTPGAEGWGPFEEVDPNFALRWLM